MDARGRVDNPISDAGHYFAPERFVDQKKKKKHLHYKCVCLNLLTFENGFALGVRFNETRRTIGAVLASVQSIIEM